KLQGQAAHLSQQIGSLESFLQAKEIGITGLENELIQDLADAIESLHNLLTQFDQTESQNETALYVSFTGQKQFFSMLKTQLESTKSRIGNLWDPGVKMLFQNQAQTLQMELDVMDGDLTMYEAELNRFKTALDDFSNFQSILEVFEFWVKAGKVVTESSSSLLSQIENFQAARQAYEDRIQITAARQGLSSNQSSLAERLSIAENLLKDIKNSLEQAFEEQTHQRAEESAFNQSLDQLRTAIGERRQLLNQILSLAVPKESGLRSGLNDLGQRLDTAAEFFDPARFNAGGVGLLSRSLEVFAADLVFSEEEFGRLENLLAQLESDRVELNQNHSLLKLRQVKENLAGLQDFFNKNASGLTLGERITALENQFGKLRADFHGSLLELGMIQASKIQGFLDRKEKEIEELQLRIAQARAFLGDLHQCAVSLRAEIEILENLELQGQLNALLDSSRVFSEEAERFMPEAAELVTELIQAIAPLKNERDGAAQIVEWLHEEGDLNDDVSVLRAHLEILSGIQAAISRFDTSGTSFKNLANFSEPSWIGLLRQSAERLHQIQIVLHPPVLTPVQTLPAYFEIPVLKKSGRGISHRFGSERSISRFRVQENRKVNKEKNPAASIGEEEKERKKEQRRFSDLVQMRKLLQEGTALNEPVWQHQSAPPPVISIPDEVRPSEKQMVSSMKEGIISLPTR
ncbi:MAG: hypothetical protein NC930_04100, partial [Candidatus Omnitrophica bacterium]|nr:hypothetical protein [Candidatus Omnitrophota bacterium]